MTDKEEEIKRKAEDGPKKPVLPPLYKREVIDWESKSDPSDVSKIKERFESHSKGKIFGYSNWGFVDQPEIDKETGKQTGKMLPGRAVGEQVAKDSFYGFIELFTYFKAIKRTDRVRLASQDEPEVKIGEKTMPATSAGLLLSDRARKDHELSVSTHNYHIAVSLHTHRMYDRLRELGLTHENAYDLSENIIRESIVSFQKIFHDNFEKGEPVKRELLHPDHSPKEVTHISVLDQFGHVHRQERPLAEKQDLEKLYKLVNNLSIRKARVY